MARYVASQINGGLLGSEFNLKVMIAMMAKVNDEESNAELTSQLQYLLNIHRKNSSYTPGVSTLASQLKELSNNFQLYELNTKVLMVMISSQFCQQMLSSSGRSDVYLKFLVAVLNNSEENQEQQVVCKTLIKFFAEKKTKNQKSLSSEKAPEELFDFDEVLKPVVNIVSNPKSNGRLLTELGIKVILAMSEFADEAKEMFFNLYNGYEVLCSLIESKNESTVLITLHLIVSLINAKANDQNHFGREIAEQDDLFMLHRLMRLITDGTEIRYAYFSNHVFQTACDLLRVFIQHCTQTKTLIIETYFSDRNLITHVVQMLRPENFRIHHSKEGNQIDKRIEGSVLSLLLSIVKDDVETKKVIGDSFIKLAGHRLEKILQHHNKPSLLQLYVSNKQLDKVKELQNQCCYSDTIRLEEEKGYDETESKFFNLLLHLVKNHSENQKKLKPYTQTLKDYLNAIVQPRIVMSEDTKQQKDNYLTVANKIRELVEIIAKSNSKK